MFSFSRKLFSKKNRQEGISLYIALIIIVIMMAIALGLSTILVGQIKTIKSIGHSVKALYAADTGIERALYDNGTASYSASGYLDLNSNGFQDADDSTYNVVGISAGSNGCPGGVSYCLKSVGTFKQTKRAIIVSR